MMTKLKDGVLVSTHSRAKAAAALPHTIKVQSQCFNTQPREGGCLFNNIILIFGFQSFNTQPREGGCFHLCCC